MAPRSGGLVTFHCGSAARVIVLTGEHILAQDTTIDGGATITLSGGNSTPLVYVLGGKTVELRKLTISNGNNSTSIIFSNSSRRDLTSYTTQAQRAQRAIVACLVPLYAFVVQPSIGRVGS